MSNDLINRQAAIDAVSEACFELRGVFGRCEDALKALPTVDAVPVVRCKDCKWWDKKHDSPYGYCKAMKHGFVSSNWEIRIYRTYKGDFYCADGERPEE